MRDLANNLQVVKTSEITLSGTTAATSQKFDLSGFNAAAIVIATGTVTDAGTSAGFTVKLQESDNNSTWNDVAVSDVAGDNVSAKVTSDSDDDKLVTSISYIGNKRYVRVSGVGSTGTNAKVYALAILGAPNYAPTTVIGSAS